MTALDHLDHPAQPFDPGELLLRAATPEDLPAFERFAEASAIGITTLPADGRKLADRLARSAQAFATGDDSSGEEIYLFVLEHAGRVIGSSGIAASAGFADRFYSYRNEMVVHASSALHASNRIHTLHLCHDLTGHTLLTSFYIEPAYEQTVAPQLLSRARLLFIAEFADRFNDRIAAESPGLADENGRCPFWDAVGRRFFAMDYPQVEQITGGRSKAFIAELMPQSPIYVPLLPEEAQWAIGQLHPVGELPFSILMDEGFDTETYVDIFDGGATVDGRVALLKTVATSHHAVQGQPLPGGWHLAATTRRNDFRATLCRALDASIATRLRTGPGERLRVAPLAMGAAA
jgi:arginine N-succinyltransferase